MALSHKLDKTAYGKLPKEMQAHYIEDGDDYVLDVEGGEDVGALKRSKDHEARARKRLEKENKELRSKLDSLDDDDDADDENDDPKDKNSAKNKREAARKKRDDEARERERTEHTERLAKREEKLKNIAIEREIEKFAGDMFTSATIGAKMIRDRFSAEIDDDGEVIVSIKGKDGSSVTDTAGLKKELLADKEFSVILKAGNGKGGGAPGSGASKSPPGAGRENLPSNQKSGDTPLAKMDTQSIVDRFKGADWDIPDA